MKKFAMLCGLLLASAAWGGDADAGAAKAIVCIACHGEGGSKPIADYPIIGGQTEQYLLYSLKAYKNGTRPNPIMVAQLAALSEADLADLAAYFAAQESSLSH